MMFNFYTESRIWQAGAILVLLEEDFQVLFSEEGEGFCSRLLPRETTASLLKGWYRDSSAPFHISKALQWMSSPQLLFSTSVYYDQHWTQFCAVRPLMYESSNHTGCACKVTSPHAYMSLASLPACPLQGRESLCKTFFRGSDFYQAIILIWLHRGHKKES